MEPSDKTRGMFTFDQVLHHRESVRKENITAGKCFHKVDVHLDEEGLEYRKPESCAYFYRISHA